MLLLEYKGSTTIPVEAEVITPRNLAGKSLGEIAALPVQHGNAQAPLGEFFAIAGDAGDQHIRIAGDCSRVKLLGTGMTCGRITIDGNAGMHLGAEMTGGEIEVFGQAGDWAGAEMRGGKIHVHGNAGHLVGGAYRGSRLGMRGGVILVDGQAGNEIGNAMRRGLIAIGGDTGDFPGVALIAGTILVFGTPGLRPGAGMKRGTLALFNGPAQLLPTFSYDCTYQPVFMQIFLRQLRAWGFASNSPLLQEVLAEGKDGFYLRFSGDLVALGKGEILCWQQRHPAKACGPSH